MGAKAATSTSAALRRSRIHTVIEFPDNDSVAYWTTHIGAHWGLGIGEGLTGP